MIKTLKKFSSSHIAGINKPIPAILVRAKSTTPVVNMLVGLNPYQMFHAGVQANPNDWFGIWPSAGEVIAVPPQDVKHIGNAVDCKIVASEKDIPDGWSNAAHADAFCCQWPDGLGKWALVSEIKPIVPEEEQDAAYRLLSAKCIHGKSDTMKQKALANAIKSLDDDALAEELFDHSMKILRGKK